MTSMTNFMVQQALNKLMGAKLTIDGDIGPKTKAVLKQFQAKFSLSDKDVLSTLQKMYSVTTVPEQRPVAVTVVAQPTTSLGTEIVRCAKQYVGLVEIKPNTVWDDLKTPGKDARATKLVEWLKKSGHQDGWSYCMSFCEASVREAIENLNVVDKYKYLVTTINPSVMSSFNGLNSLNKISKVPVVGSIGFMQKGSSGMGHAFIVERVVGNTLYTVEGNTSASGATVEADRNGDLIITKSRPLSFAKSNGLWIRGFWNPTE